MKSFDQLKVAHSDAGSFFVDDFLLQTGLSKVDLKIVAQNIERTAQVLHRACVNRNLKLDLDIGETLLRKDPAKKSSSLFRVTALDQICEDNRLSLGASYQGR